MKKESKTADGVIAKKFIVTKKATEAPALQQKKGKVVEVKKVIVPKKATTVAPALKQKAKM